ncbi:MAG TPA: acyl dehydratase, partial [Myxococcaceae bacterium]|nr:acyl dehydratase [Myxococcaceae bacterium]
RYFAELDLWAENQKGELVLRGGAQIQLFLSLEDENRQRSGQPPVVVPAPRESILPPAPPTSAPRKEPAVAAPVSGVKKATPRESHALRKAPEARKTRKK